MKQLFSLGQIVATPGALEALEEARQAPLHLLNRHLIGDWGDLDKEDIKANNDALIYGDRLFSAYRLTTGEKVWIITEADRSSTCILLPEDY